MLTVLHIIHSLPQGGAEIALLRLVRHPSDHVRHVVVSMTDEGYYGSLIRSANVEFHELGMSKWNLPLGIPLIRCLRIMKKVKPDIVQTWIYHADLFGGIAAKIHGGKLVWGIHSFSLSKNALVLQGRVIAKICAMTSRWMPDRVVTCSTRSIESHRRHGYSVSRFTTIPLGYDLDEFRHVPGAKKRYGSDLRLPDDAFVFGCVARWDPVKDFRNLLEAFGELSHVRDNSYMVLCGASLTEENEDLLKLVSECGVDFDRLRLIGFRSDIPEVMSFIDVHVLASLSEAFPNVVAEAMACETPCIVTDVGDASIITGGLGWVVPPSNPIALKDAMLSAMEESRDPRVWEERRKASRKKIIDHYGIDVMVKKYLSVWGSVVRS